MTRFVLALLRILAVCLAFTLSGFVAAGFLTFALFLGADLGWLQEDPIVTAGSAAFLLTSWFFIVVEVFWPAAGLIVVMEFARIRSMTLYVLAGGVCALVVLVLDQSTGSLAYSDSEIWTAFLAAGFVGGLSYWLLAGHRAGKWLGPDPDPQATAPVGRDQESS